MLSAPRVPASSRLMAYSSEVRRSRAPATRVCMRTLAMSVAMVSATASITAKVTTYCTFATAKVRRGGTKKKLKQMTLRTAVSVAGPRPRRRPAIAAPSR